MWDQVDGVVDVKAWQHPLCSVSSCVPGRFAAALASEAAAHLAAIQDRLGFVVEYGLVGKMGLLLVRQVETAEVSAAGKPPPRSRLSCLSMDG